MPRLRGFVCLLLGGMMATHSVWGADRYPDLERFFQRANAGEPIRFVALGGSITDAGKGWIGDWLKERFPKSPVTTVNAGLSGTGSDLAVFRLERDVLSYQPDLVAIEFCVNDAGITDEETLYFMEGLVVRLKSQDRPPAILIIEAAAEKGSNIARHRRVAQHYGLLEVDLQEAVDRHLKSGAETWKDLFSDDVHPTARGHALYRKTIEERLDQLLAESPTPSSALPLPVPLSSRPLILNGKMSSLASYSHIQGWKRSDTMPPHLSRFFQSPLATETPGTDLRLTFRGTAAGLLYLRGNENGSAYVSIDGLPNTLLRTDGKIPYSYKILTEDLQPGDHQLTISLPRESPATALLRNGPVQLLYLLTGGAEGDRPPASVSLPNRLAELAFIPCDKQWRWSQASPAIDPQAKDARGTWMLSGNEPNTQSWTEVPDGSPLDFRKLAGTNLPSVAVASTLIHSDHATPALLAVQVDYFARVWVNGVNVGAVSRSHGSPSDALLFPIQLNKGENRLVVQVGAGSGGHRLSCWWAPIPEPL